MKRLDKTTLAIVYVGLLFLVPLAVAVIGMKLARRPVLSVSHTLKSLLAGFAAAAPFPGKPSGAGR